MAGMDRNTGKALSGWQHVVQSMQVLVTTALESRVMRRNVGSRVPRLVDAPISPSTLIDFYAAVSTAIDKFEPRFKLKRISVEGVSQGRLSLHAMGTYYPRGHLGDFSVTEAQEARFVI